MRPALKLLIILVLVEIALTLNPTRVHKPNANSAIAGITGPALAMQFATQEAPVTTLLGGTDTVGKDNRQILWWQQWIDFLYIALYWAFFFYVVGGPMRSERSAAPILGKILGVLITVAAVCDILENVGILLALIPDYAGPFWPFGFAVTKWFCFYVGLLSAAAFFISYPRLGAFPMAASRVDLLGIVIGLSLAVSSITGLVGALGAAQVIQDKATWLIYAFYPLLVALPLLLLWFIVGVMRPAMSLHAGQRT